MKMKTCKKIENGFTLVEVMVALGLGSILLLALMQISTLLMQIQSTSERGEEVISLMYELNNSIGNEPICTSALVGKSNLASTPIALSSQMQTGGVYGKLTINSLSLQNINLISGVNYSAEVEIQGTKAGTNFGGNTFSKKIRIFYEVDGANNITRCISPARSPASDCTALGGTWSGGSCDLCASLGGTTVSGVCTGLGGGGGGGPCVNVTQSRDSFLWGVDSVALSTGALYAITGGYPAGQYVQADVDSAFADLADDFPRVPPNCVTTSEGCEDTTTCEYTATYGTVSISLFESELLLCPADCGASNRCPQKQVKGAATVCISPP